MVGVQIREKTAEPLRDFLDWKKIIKFNLRHWDGYGDRLREILWFNLADLLDISFEDIELWVTLFH
jgi:hypothetical protein